MKNILEILPLAIIVIILFIFFNKGIPSNNLESVSSLGDYIVLKEDIGSKNCNDRLAQSVLDGSLIVIFARGSKLGDTLNVYQRTIGGIFPGVDTIATIKHGK